jgi:hypothetical protein
MKPRLNNCISSIFRNGYNRKMTGCGDRRPVRSGFVFIVLILGSLAGVHAQTQTDISGPTGSGRFGASVTVLSNGNFVVSDPFFDDGATDIGAVYLYNGQTGLLITRMTGGSTGDMIGFGGVYALPNGNYVVSSPAYTTTDGNEGAVSFCSGTNGCSQVGSLGSMFGNFAGARIGGTDLEPFPDTVTSFFKGVTVLANGNFVVVSRVWGTGSGFSSLGAVTLCSGTSGCPNTVSAGNSLIGAAQFDVVGSTNVGSAATNGVAALSNGNYVVNSPNFDAGSSFQNVGASTFCSGTTGCVGVVSSSNSLVGGRPGDRVGEGTGGGPGVVDLRNGKYVVQNPQWNAPTVSKVGAVTFCDPTGCRGAVSASNSLIGSTQDDNVGGGTITVLTNGNYVVSTSTWDNAGIANVGAATFCSGTIGCSGTISTSNSVVGSLAQDSVGRGGAVALANGNYVVLSSGWNGSSTSVGAVTFCNGITGCSGSVTAGNSLVGIVAFDTVGSRVAALPNGSYVVTSPGLDNGGLVNVGAATFCNGTTGCIGKLSLSNSLFGTQTGDNVAEGGVAVLTNGNYVVSSPRWDNGPLADAGASTFCSGATGCSGAVSVSNSQFGTTAGDGVLGTSGSTAIAALTNGNYVVSRIGWDNGTTANAGAVSWCSGTSGCFGPVTTTNSLVGSTANDQISSGAITSGLPGGNYVVGSKFWDSVGIIDANAVTFGKSDGSTTGPITASNSVIGNTRDTVAGFVIQMVYGYDTVNQQLIVGRRLDNKVTIFRPNTSHRTSFDFDGDGRSDLSVFRSPESNWYRLNSSDSSFAAFRWGVSTDKIVPADYDGDGKTDHAIFRDGVWWIFQSMSSQARVVQFGIAGDLPRPGDYDGDGSADLCIFRPSTGTWWRQNSSNGQFAVSQFGANGDAPMLGDYDGDGKTDLAVYRPSNAVWYILRSSDGHVKADQFGLTGDIPLNGDFNADGKGDLAVFRPSNGVWYVARPTGVPSQNFDATPFGLSTDTPIPADYDGDGKTDIAIYRNGVWWISKSSGGEVRITQFGITSDRPVEGAYLQ